MGSNGLFKSTMKKIIFGVCASMLLNPSIAYGQTQLHKPMISVSEQKDIYYIGNVTSNVNVRVDAGADKEQLIFNNKKISLNKGTQVIILGEVDVSGKPWYHIRFTYSGTDLTGYSTSSYIEKTATVITPSPEPTATPEPTAAPTPTIQPTMAPEHEVSPNPSASPSNDANQEDGKPYFLLFAVLGVMVIAVGCYVVWKKKKDQQQEDSTEVSEKVEKLKKIVLNGNEERTSQRHKLKNGVYIKKDDQEAQQEFAASQEEEVKNEESPITDLEEMQADAKAAVASESADKKALRVAIAKLREHDIVIHKYFGKGEVFDNSDVRLIEVRFGQDVRFLNKEQLVSKKLLEITNERRV